MTTTRVALIQMSCAPDTHHQPRPGRRALRPAEPPASAQPSSASSPSSSAPSTSASVRTTPLQLSPENASLPSKTCLTRVCEETGVVLVASLFERRAPGLYHNTAVTIEKDGRISDMYRKMHIPDDPLYYEKFYFTPGDLGFKATATSAGKIGTLVCWDQWYPEAARLHRPPAAPRPSSSPPPSAGTPPKRTSSAPPSTKPGRPPSAPTPSPMAGLRLRRTTA